MSDLLTVSEAAAYAGVSVQTIYRLLREDRLQRYETITGLTAVSKAELDAAGEPQRLPEVLDRLIERANALLSYEVRAQLAARLLPEQPPGATGCTPH